MTTKAKTTKTRKPAAPAEVAAVIVEKTDERLTDVRMRSTT